MTTILTVLGSVGGTILLFFLVFLFWGYRKLSLVQTALRAEHGGAGGDEVPTDPMPSSYSTLADDLEPEPDKNRLVVLNRECGSCDHFALGPGQRLLDAHPAFRQVAQTLQPWQMGQKRNPDYIAIERKIYEVEEGKEGPIGKGNATALRGELATLEEYLEAAPDSLSKNMKVEWRDFGLCSEHRHLRAKTDTCDRFKPLGGGNA